MGEDILAYHQALSQTDQAISTILHTVISESLPGAESKVWHGHPVWFLEGNPIVGYHRLKNDMRVLFWSGQSFDEPGLTNEGSFKAAELRITSPEQIDQNSLKRYLEKARTIQWDYKNIRQNRGVLHRIDPA